MEIKVGSRKFETGQVVLTKLTSLPIHCNPRCTHHVFLIGINVLTINVRNKNVIKITIHYTDGKYCNVCFGTKA